MGEEKFSIHDGSEAKQVPVETRSGNPGDVAKDESKAPAPKKEESAEREFYCSNCRKRYKESECRKDPLDFVRTEDRKLEKSITRFSVFCAVCNKYFAVIDKIAYDTLQAMVSKPKNEKKRS